MDIKNVSRSKDSGPWSGDFQGEMWRKSAIRRLSKRLPMSTDLEQTIRADDEIFNPAPQNIAEARPEEKTVSKTRSSRLKKIIKETEVVEGTSADMNDEIPADQVPI
jgi:recombination protein RecT